MGVIYQFTFPDGMKYIGKTQDYHRRMQSYRRGDGKRRKVTIWVDKFGWNNVKKEILWRGDNVQLNTEEIRLIAEVRTLWPEGLNMTIGGDGDPEATKKQWVDPDVRARRIESITKAHKKSRNLYSESMRHHMANQTKEQRAARTSEESKRKRKATWDAKREAKLALLPPKVAEKERRKAAVNAIWFERDGKELRKRQRTASSRSATQTTEEDESLIPSDYEEGEIPGYVPLPFAIFPHSRKSEQSKGTVSYQSTNVVDGSCIPQTQAGGLYTQWEDSEEEQEANYVSD